MALVSFPQAGGGVYPTEIRLSKKAGDIAMPLLTEFSGVRIVDAAEDIEDKRAHFARLGVPSQCPLGKDQLAVHHDLENAARTRNQTPRTDERFDLALAQNFRRQTDGAVGIVSGG